MLIHNYICSALLIFLFHSQFASTQSQLLANPIRNTLNLWSHLLDRIVYSDSPIDQQLPYIVNDKSLPHLQPLLAPIQTSSPLPNESAIIRKSKIINEELLYRLLPPTKDQVLKLPATESSDNATVQPRTTTLSIDSQEINEPNSTFHNNDNETSNANSEQEESIENQENPFGLITSILPKEDMDNEASKLQSTEPLPETLLTYNITTQNSSFAPQTEQNQQHVDEMDGMASRIQNVTTVTAATITTLIYSSTDSTIFIDSDVNTPTDTDVPINFSPEINVQFRLKMNRKSIDTEKSPSQITVKNSETISRQKEILKPLTMDDSADESEEKESQNKLLNECNNDTICDEMRIQSGNNTMMNNNVNDANDEIISHFNGSTADEFDLTNDYINRSYDNNSKESFNETTIIKTNVISETFDDHLDVYLNNTHNNSESNLTRSSSQLEAEPTLAEVINLKHKNSSKGVSESTRDKNRSDIPDAEEDESSNNQVTNTTPTSIKSSITEHITQPTTNSSFNTSNSLDQPFPQTLPNFQPNTKPNLNLLTPINNIIDGIGPIILPLLGYTRNNPNSYYPYVKQVHGVKTYVDNKIGDDAVRNIYADDSLLGLSTAIAREILSNQARTQHADVIAQQQPSQQQYSDHEMKESVDQLESTHQSTITTHADVNDKHDNNDDNNNHNNNNGNNNEDNSNIQSSNTERQHSINTNQKDLNMIQPSRSVPVAKSMMQSVTSEASSKDLKSTLNKPVMRNARIVNRTIKYPSSKVLTYPRITLNPSRNDYQQTFAGDIHKDSALAQHQYVIEEHSRPIAKVPVMSTVEKLTPETTLATKEMNIIVPRFNIKGFPDSSKDSKRYDSQRAFNNNDGTTAEMSSDWSHQLLARETASMRDTRLPSRFYRRKSQSTDSLNTSGKLTKRDDNSYNDSHSEATRSRFINRSELLSSKQPFEHDESMLKSNDDNANTGMLSSLPKDTKTSAGFGRGRTPDATYEAMFNVQLNRS
ncbi:unnamed protein product [Anisakis simplex]|uniref:Serine/threonine-protein kinase DDB_G0282963 n=1 Tax=Anisakis simplex TaxID=6269 RepID=A0A0M3JUY8_ANISI|nr:unnamed protein product [Anisakis simplex]